MVANNGYTVHRFTQAQKTKPEKKYNGLSERQFIIEKFKDKTYKIEI